MNNESQSSTPVDCEPASAATWTQKITAIKLAAERTNKSAVRQVTRNLDVGIEHMEYKDFTEFGCCSEEQYIFGEAVHLIEELGLPFDQALLDVMLSESPTNSESSDSAS